MKRISIYIISAIFLIIVLAGTFTINTASNSVFFKKYLLNELKNLTGKEFVANRIYINLFPTFIEITDLKFVDENNNTIFSADKVKGYIKLSGLLSRQIVINKLFIKNTNIHSNSEQIEIIVENVEKYLKEVGKLPFKAVIKSIQIDNSNILLAEKEKVLNITGLDANIILSNQPNFRIFSNNLTINYTALPEFKGHLDSYFVILNNILKLKKLAIFHKNSEANIVGSVKLDGLSGEFKTTMDLAIASIKNIFGLKNNEYGYIRAEGTVNIANIKDILNDSFVDIKLKGDLYIETLMEAIKVKEKIKGYLSFNGEVKGLLNDLKGKASITLTKANLFGVEVDNLECVVNYKDKKMTFNNGTALLYGGSAQVEVMIALSAINYHILKVKAKDISSKGIFKLIKWDPHISEGLFLGEVYSAGNRFNPHGNFVYKNLSIGDNILKKIKNIKGSFALKDNILYFPFAEVSTDNSIASVSGSVDLNNRTLQFQSNVSSGEIREFLSPYITALSGQGILKVVVSGQIDDPIIDIDFTSQEFVFTTTGHYVNEYNKLNKKSFQFDSTQGILTYRKNLLNFKNFSSKKQQTEISISGDVYFREAKELFEMSNPEYNILITAKDIETNELSSIFPKSLIINGKIDTLFKAEGKYKEIKISGDIRGSDILLDNKYQVEKIDGNFSYFGDKERFLLDPITFENKGANLTLKGSISLDGEISFVANGKNIDILNLFPEKLKDKFHISNFNQIISPIIKIKAEGLLDNPYIEANGILYGRINKGQMNSKGTFNCVLKDKNLFISSKLFDDKLSLKGEIRLEEQFNWTVDFEFNSLKSDILMYSLFKNIPDGLFFNIEGNMNLYGDKNNINGDINFKKVFIYMYENSFTNTNPVIVSLKNNKITFNPIYIKSKNSELELGGSMIIGENYDLYIEGSTLLDPLKTLHKDINILKGDGQVLLLINGDWDSPKINGGIEINNGTFGLKHIPYRISSVSAYMYFDKDRIVIDYIDGKVAGGSIKTTGVVSLNRFSVRDFYIDSKLKDITTFLVKKFSVNFDGNLYYKGDISSQEITGNVAIKRANYTGRMDWISWLLKGRKESIILQEKTDLNGTKLNVQVLGNNINIDNNLAKVSVKASIFLKGTTNNPIPLGKIEADKGIIYLRNREFRIIKARVDFVNPKSISLYFDINTETSVNNYIINAVLEGYPDKFNLLLSSNPALSESKILNLLTVGHIEQPTQTTEIGAVQATSFLTEGIQGMLQEQIKTITSIDRVYIEPHISKITGVVSYMITAQKRLLEDKLYTTYSSTINYLAAQEQILKVEYILNKNVSLIGKRDERESIGLDVKFRFEFK